MKRREAFRPFAPAILLEEADKWFELEAGRSESPFMLRVARFREDKAGLVPAVVHVDGTGRLQTVTQEDGRYHTLLARFFARTGVPILLNTSFNVAGEPIVETPEDALFGLLFAGLDCCVFSDRIVHRKPELESILDLRVELSAEWISVTLPGGGCGGLARLLEDELPRGPLRRPSSMVASDAEPVLVKNLAARGESYVTLRVATPWGPASAFVELQALHILRRANGENTGRQILALLNARGDDIDEASFIRALGWLHRTRIIRFHERTR